MRDIYPFPGNLNWYKGNLHCHTGLSDAILSPNDKAALYKQNGFHFLSITDHNVFNAQPYHEDENFLLLPGVELNIEYAQRPGSYHIVAFGARGEISYPDNAKFAVPICNDSSKAQEIINDIIRHNGLAMLCHPVWCMLELCDFENLTGLFAIEVYNHNCFLRVAAELRIYIGTAF